MAAILRVGFTQRGGFVPTWRGCEIDVDALSADEAATLRGLVVASGIQTMTDIRIAGADMVTYTFTIGTNDGTHVVTIDGPAVPESVRPLVQYLRAHARNLLEDS